MNIYAHEYTYTSIHSSVDKYVYIQIYVYMQTHTYTHTYMWLHAHTIPVVDATTALTSHSPIVFSPPGTVYDKSQRNTHS